MEMDPIPAEAFVANIFTKLYFDPITDVCIGYSQQNDQSPLGSLYVLEDWTENVDRRSAVEGEYLMPSIRAFVPLGLHAQTLLSYAQRRHVK